MTPQQARNAMIRRQHAEVTAPRLRYKAVLDCEHTTDELATACVAEHAETAGTVGRWRALAGDEHTLRRWLAWSLADTRAMRAGKARQ